MVASPMRATRGPPSERIASMEISLPGTNPMEISFLTTFTSSDLMWEILPDCPCDILLSGRMFMMPSETALQGVMQHWQSTSTGVPIIWHILMADSSEMACSMRQASSWAVL